LEDIWFVRQVRLIRHGESAANAGEASLDHATTPLTPKGVEQAHFVACSFRTAPDVIVASPFTRAASTAMATVAKFIAVPLETWPTQEFTYLELSRGADTTVTQRREWVDAYWTRSDPAFREGPEAESFLEINAVAWLIECTPQRVGSRAMADWREYEIANHVPHCSGYTLSKDPDDAGWKMCRSEQQIEVTHRVPGRILPSGS